MTTASQADISSALQVLFDALPFQRGSRVDNVAAAYLEALRGASLDSVRAGISKFLRGECQDVSLKFVPTPPELARIIRTTVVPSIVPKERRIEQTKQETPRERARMRLKFPLFRYAMQTGRINQLAKANEEGFEAMVLLARKWGVDVPDEFSGIPSEQLEREWREARNLAWREIERNPPPFLRQYSKRSA